MNDESGWLLDSILFWEAEGQVLHLYSTQKVLSSYQVDSQSAEMAYHWVKIK